MGQSPAMESCRGACPDVASGAGEGLRAVTGTPDTEVDAEGCGRRGNALFACVPGPKSAGPLPWAGRVPAPGGEQSSSPDRPRALHVSSVPHLSHSPLSQPGCLPLPTAWCRGEKIVFLGCKDSEGLTGSGTRSELTATWRSDFLDLRFALTEWGRTLWKQLLARISSCRVSAYQLL